MFKRFGNKGLWLVVSFLLLLHQTAGHVVVGTLYVQSHRELSTLLSCIGIFVYVMHVQGEWRCACVIEGMYSRMGYQVVLCTGILFVQKCSFKLVYKLMHIWGILTTYIERISLANEK